MKTTRSKFTNLSATYVCPCCGEEFNDPDEVSWEESRGEFWGMPVYEKYSTLRCPYCGEEITEDDIKEDEAWQE